MTNTDNERKTARAEGRALEASDRQPPADVGSLIRGTPEHDLAGACIMIVDDEPCNLNILDTMLRHERYQVVAFPRGQLALEAAAEVKPDLVLLDVGLPDLNGFEVCKQLKSKPGFETVPVIFISGHAETEDKIQAFQAGGVDYVTKPFSEIEVSARVRTHLSIRWHTFHLGDLIQKRSEELSAAHRRLRSWDEAKTSWINMLAHELRTPLTSVFCTASVLFKKVQTDREYSDMREDFDWSFKRITKLIDDAVALASLGEANSTFVQEPVSVSDAMRAACSLAREHAADVRFEVSELFDKEAALMAVPDLLRRAFTDLLITAACCTPENGTVAVSSCVKRNRVQIDIATPGKGLPAADLDTFFDVGGQRTLLKGGADFGLGPALGKCILLLFKTEVSVRNGTAAGIVISIRLPAARPESDPLNDRKYSSQTQLAPA